LGGTLNRIADRKRVADQCDSTVLLLFLLKLLLGGFFEGHSVLAEVKATKFLWDPSSAAVRVEDILSLLL